MLRASIDHPDNGFTAGLSPRPVVTGSGSTGVAHDGPVMGFVDAVVLHDTDEYPEARAALERAVGVPATDRVAMVAGNFSMMNRALDAVGAPVHPGLDDLATEMGVTIPDHLRAG
ncbi:MAG: hypothetical protein GWN79_03145 [Actinobacteria bacterium]|nr:hypothetical protein [Actinomycetota bacterium]NIT94528.1 hypothetical protein [Actinomycetota bacterium]NIU18140.1 hypothetical protein [Actinomycetota bacterium]NIV54625.1 hypothetical protein [Actinomycetota bacterium]NIX49513.1 hypothetical protein [Actinomycetota bacterium]